VSVVELLSGLWSLLHDCRHLSELVDLSGEKEAFTVINSNSKKYD
jgi:hypothetical protein